MGQTPLFHWPFPVGGDAPNGPFQIEAALDAIESRLEILRLLVGTPEAAVAPKPGELLLVDGTNHPAYKAATGDVTVNSAGVTTIGASKVTAEKIANLAVEAAKIASSAVETAKIAGLAVTTAKLGELAVTAAKLAAEAVETGKIKNLAVTEAKLADAVVTSRKLKPLEGEVLYAGGEAWLSPAVWSNFAQAEVTVATPSILHAEGVVSGGSRAALNSAGQVFADWFVDGVQQGRTMIFGFEQSPGVPGIPRTGIAMTLRVGLATGAHTVSLQARGSNNSEAVFSPTGLKYVVYSQ